MNDYESPTTVESASPRRRTERRIDDARIDEIRKVLFAGTVTVEEYSRAKGQSTKTTRREMARGLPFVQDGRTKRIVLDKAAARLRGELPEPKPTRGRPRTTAT